MVDNLVFRELLLLGLLWFGMLLYWAWLRGRAATYQTTPTKTITARSKDLEPFPGLIHKPHCDACEHAVEPHAQGPASLPPLLTSIRGRRRAIDTRHHFCPPHEWAYYGWTGRGNVRANGHPGGKPWRPLEGVACHGYFQETHDTPMHGKRVAAQTLVWAVGALAEGLGIRAVARVFEVDPNTVLAWLVEVADQAAAFLRYFLHDLSVSQLQLEELFALLSAVKVGEINEDEAIQRLSRAPHWVWGAMDPVSKLLLTIDVGDRTLAMAQRVVHQVVQILAPDCIPLFLTDGYKEYATALLSHFGHWVQPARRQAQGPVPKPPWMPHPKLHYAQVVKQTRRRCLVHVQHRVVFGTLMGIKQVLTATGWQINTAFIERINLPIRQPVAAVGRRVMTVCKGEAGVRQQLTLCHVYYNFCLPHASLRQPLPQPEPTNGCGSAKRWRPATPVMAAGLTDHVWTLREILLYRVPPWPQPQAL